MRHAILAFLLITFTLASLDARPRAQRGDKLTVYDANAIDEAPEFPGGDREMLRFVSNNLKTPAGCEDVRGRVVCGFVVMPDGRLTHVSVLCSLEPECDREALRLINAMPRWKPGRRNDSAVPVYNVVNIWF